MLRRRLIPVLLLKNGALVRSELFRLHQIIGDPYHEVRRFNEWNVDELIYLDITREAAQTGGRSDHRTRPLEGTLNILEEVSRSCFMPLTWGGGIRSLEDMHQRFERGADKITLNTAAFDRPELITEAAQAFGSQAVVVSIDVWKPGPGPGVVYVEGGTRATGWSPADWARECEHRGAGEILLQTIQRDGTASGYDIESIGAVAGAVSVPVIACSGVGRFEDYAAGIAAGASAVAAANLWHFKELADRMGKKALAKAGVQVRL